MSAATKRALKIKEDTLDAIQHLACLLGKVPTEGQLAEYMGITRGAASSRMQKYKDPRAKLRSPARKRGDYYDSHMSYAPGEWRGNYQ